jgi:hypothetical protein
MLNISFLKVNKLYGKNHTFPQLNLPILSTNVNPAFGGMSSFPSVIKNRRSKSKPLFGVQDNSSILGKISECRNPPCG